MPATLLATTAVTAATALITSIGLTPAAAPNERTSCEFRLTTVRVLAELTGDTSERGKKLRTMLIDSGVGKPGFLPKQCISGGGQDSGTGGGQDGGSAPGAGSDESGGSNGSGSGSDDTGGGVGGDTGSSAGAGKTAAQALGWGEPSKVDEFEGGIDGWSLYDGPGHAGNGTRSPDAASVDNGLLTINGSGDGTTAGMAWGDGQQYGGWEGRMKAPKGSPSYNALFLLWPSAENFPVGGEIDFAEITDASRQKVNLFLHYGEDNSQVEGDVEVDATQWHNYAVEWTPEGVTAFLDGKEWWKTTDTSILPPGPMHLCIQLDWFPKGDSEKGQLQVDWVKQYPPKGGASSSGGQDSAGSSDSGSSDDGSSEDSSGGGEDSSQNDQPSSGS